MANGPRLDGSLHPEEQVELRIPANAEYVRVVRLAVTGVASRLAFSVDDIEDIKLAVTEACNNAILHANGPSLAEGVARLPSVIIQFRPRPDGLHIAVSDTGRVAPPGLPDVEAPQTPREAVAELPESGWGLLLMQTLMDEVEQHTGATSDTTVRMVKYVPARS